MTHIVDLSLQRVDLSQTHSSCGVNLSFYKAAMRQVRLLVQTSLCACHTMSFWKINMAAVCIPFENGNLLIYQQKVVIVM